MTKRISLFIDYANLWSSNRTIKSVIDFKKLIHYLEARFRGSVSMRQIYFAYPEEQTRGPEYDFDAIHRFGTYLKKELKFRIRKKPLKRIPLRDEDGAILTDKGGNIRFLEKGNLDIELAIDAVMTHESYDDMILFSGDSDFLTLVHFIQKRGKRVHIFSTKNNISTELRFGGNSYTDIADIPEIMKNNLHSKQRKT